MTTEEGGKKPMNHHEVEYYKSILIVSVILIVVLVAIEKLTGFTHPLFILFAGFLVVPIASYWYNRNKHEYYSGRNLCDNHHKEWINSFKDK